VPEVRLQRSALLAGVAEGVVATALPLLTANLTHDPLDVAKVVAAQHLPWILAALIWPALARGDRRTLVGLVHTVRALAVGYLGFLALGGFETLPKIMTVAFVIGLGEALTGIVEEETGDLRLSTRGMLGLALVGMPLGGLLYEIFLAVPFLLDVLFFALAALFALFVPRPVERVTVLHAGRPTFAPGTTAVTITAFLASVARSAVFGVLVLFALVDLGLGAPAFGILLACLAAATAVGAWMAPEAGESLGLSSGFVAGAILAAAGLLAASQLADPDRFWIGAVALGVAWGGAATATVLLRALLPAAAGRPVVGSSLRAFHLVEWSGVVVGALLGGYIGGRQTVSAVLLWAAGTWVAAALGAVAVRRSIAAAPPTAIPDRKWLDAA